LLLLVGWFLSPFVLLFVVFVFAFQTGNVSAQAGLELTILPPPLASAGITSTTHGSMELF
jgi:hypothetical protein